MAEFIQPTQSVFAKVFAGLHRRHPYRWYEVEVSCF
jgi:hypothetical protein